MSKGHEPTCLIPHGVFFLRSHAEEFDCISYEHKNWLEHINEGHAPTCLIPHGDNEYLLNAIVYCIVDTREIPQGQKGHSFGLMHSDMPV